MKVRLLKEHKVDGVETVLPVQSILDLDEIGAKALQASGIAEVYTDEMETVEKKIAVKAYADTLAIKNVQVVGGRKTMAELNVTDYKKMLKDDEHLIGRAFQLGTLRELGQEGIQRIENKMGRKFYLDATSKEHFEVAMGTKAVVGMSEGTAADGGDIVTEGVTKLMGLIYAHSEFLNKANKLNMADQQNAQKVVFESSDWFTAANAPIATIATEGAALTPTKLALGAIDVYPRVPNVLIATTAELLEDVAGLESEIVRQAKQKLEKVIEGLCFFGTSASGAQGFSGINDASAAAQVATQTVASIAAPTLAELQGFVNKVIPAMRKTSAWYMSNAMWTTLQGSSALITAANINLQLINLVNQTLLGYPVVIVETIPASAPIFFGSAENYTLVQGRGGEVMLFSREAYFLSGQLAWRLTKRVGGCVAAAKYTLSDSSTVAPFVKVSVQGS